MSIETLVKEYHKLSEADRMRFLELIHPFDESENDLSPEWIAEIKRRLAAYESGEVAALESDEADNRIIKEYGIEL